MWARKKGKGMKWMSHEEKRPCSCRLGKVLSSLSRGFRDRHWAEVCHDLSKDLQWWPRFEHHASYHVMRRKKK